MATVLITGSSRGIGLELVRQLLDLPASEIAKVFAVTRNSNSNDIQDLLNKTSSRLTNFIIADLSDQRLVQNAVGEVERKLQGRGLDILVNNAGTGVVAPNGIYNMPGQEILDVMNANVVSAHTMTAAFLPLLRKGEWKKVINVTSALGSMAQYSNFKMMSTYSYKLSKAAMNMLTVAYASDLESEGFTIVALSPGWIKTELGSQNADLDIVCGVGAVKNSVLDQDKSKNGKFLTILASGWENHVGMNQYDGGELLW